MARRGEVGSLLVQMRADLGQLKLDVKEVEQTFKSGFKNVETSAQKLSRTISAPIEGLKRLAVGFGAFQLGRSIIQAGAQVETLKTRLESMTGSATEAARIYGVLADLANTTPFELRNVVEAGVTLRAFGADAERTIKIVADLAAFMGVDIVQAANAFGRAFAAGSGAADILRDRGVLAFIKMKAQVADLTKLSLPEFRKVMIETLEDPQTGVIGATDRLSKTFQGAMSNMQDAWFNLANAIAQSGLIDALTTAMKGAAGLLDDITRAIAATKRLIELQGISRSIGGQGAIMGGIKEQFGAPGLEEFLPEKSALKPPPQVIPETKKKTKELTSLEKEIKEVAKRFSETWNVSMADALVEAKKLVSESAKAIEEGTGPSFAEIFDTEELEERALAMEEPIRRAREEWEANAEQMRLSVEAFAQGAGGAFDTLDREFGESLQAFRENGDELNRVLVESSQQFNFIGKQAGIFGDEFDVVGTKAAALRAEIDALLRLSIQPLSEEGLARLQERLRGAGAELQGLQEIIKTQQVAEDLIRGGARGITDSLRGAALGIQTLEQAFKNMGVSAVSAIADVIFQLAIIKPMVDSARASLAGGGGGGGGSLGSLFSGIGGFFKNLLGFQEGGIVPGRIGQPRLAVVHGGEEVIPPGRAMGVTNIFHIDARGAQRGVKQEIERAMEQMSPKIVKRSVAAVEDERRRSNRFANTFGKS